VLIDTEVGGKKKTYVATGDVSYVKENLLGIDSAPGKFISNAFASGNAYGILKAMDDIVNYAEQDSDRLLIVHDVDLWKKYPSRQGADGLYLAEVCLAPGETSKL
jgi:hypothetical protein